MPLLHEELTDKIIGAFYAVYNGLGYGFLEKVYENGMRVELEKLGLSVKTQVPITVFYKEQSVGEYFADLVVEDSVIVELKAAESLSESHDRQLINYLRATGKETGLLLNFGKKAEFRRKVMQRTKRG